MIGVLQVRVAHDGQDAWVVQLHRATVAVSRTTIYPGAPARWHAFDPSRGLDELRHLLTTVGRDEVVGDVGVTSHVGDLLGRAAIPSRLARPR